MQLPLLTIHYLHVFFGAVLVGSSVFMHFVLVPALLRRPSAEAKLFFDSLQKPISVLMGVSSGATLLMGILRGTVFGQIRSLETLTNAYGMTFIVAMVLTLAMMIHGPKTGPKLQKILWNGNEFVPDAIAKARAVTRVAPIAIILILACMVLMHFGL